MTMTYHICSIYGYCEKLITYVKQCALYLHHFIRTRHTVAPGVPDLSMAHDCIWIHADWQEMLSAQHFLILKRGVLW